MQQIRGFDGIHDTLIPIKKTINIVIFMEKIKQKRMQNREIITVSVFKQKPM